MAEYIDKNKLGVAIYNFGGENFYTLGVLSLLRDFPTADVAPVRHGEWGTEIHGIERSVCSECRAVYEGGPYNYCPKCGAKMDGEVLKREDQNSSALSYDFDIGWSVRV